MPRSRFNHEAFMYGVMFLIVFLLFIMLSLRPSCPGTPEHDVFLNFRGPDVRHKFVRPLHNSLRKKSVKSFLDEDNLRIGESAELAFLKAITDSWFAIIIFSKDYASSTWCLEELTHIMVFHGCRERAFPIFYGVKPSDVMNQTGVFAQPFAEYREKFKHSDDKDKVLRWELALRAAAKRHGWDLKKMKSKENLIKIVVHEISTRLALLTSPTSWEKKRQWAGCVLFCASSVVMFLLFKSPAKRVLEPYHVFVNYYGEESFAGKLCADLESEKLQTFRDKGLGSGAEFTREIQDAIVQSRVAVIIVTKSFAESTGCVDALKKIMEYQDRGLLRVVPVYYRVNRSDLSWLEDLGKPSSILMPGRDGQISIDATDAIVRHIKEKLDDCKNLPGWLDQSTLPNCRNHSS